MTDALQLSTGFPEVAFAVGDAVVYEGGTDGAIWVLVEGSCAVRKGDVLVNTVTQPGSMIGEVSVLLGVGHSATVEAVVPSRLRLVADGRAWLASDPAVAMFVAAGLAERVTFLTSYVSVLQHQYEGTPEVPVAPDVLRKLAHRLGRIATFGSSRESDATS